jgi:hypothetical protein
MNTAFASGFVHPAISPVDDGTRTQSPGDTVIKAGGNDSFLKKKVDYSAKDSMIVDQANQKAYLYNDAKVLYDGLDLKAGYIEIDFRNSMVYATTIKDSAGNDVQKPEFSQGEDKFTAGKIAYNFKTKKGKIVDVITQQGEGFIHGRDIKKDTNNVYYVGHGKYTTCNLDHPHFYIGAKKIKVIPDDKIVTGPAVLYIADIPTPLAIPFGYFPNKKGRASGILIPTYGESTNLGFFLKDGGFYFGMNEYADLALRGDIYSNGSYGAKAASSYRQRYKYNGGLNLSYSRLIEGDRELPNSTYRNDFFVRWIHNQDPKSRPNSRFSANVNAGSSSYNKYNGDVNGDYLANTFQSNISYSKNFQGTPFNFSTSARHSQNTITKKVDISLPELALNMNRIYPFKSKGGAGNKWYDKIGISATANARNDISAYDTTLFTNRTLGQMKNGLRFTMPISTSFNVLKYFTFTPSINTASNIYFQSVKKRYDPNINHVFTDTLVGARMANDFSVSSALSTRLYGDYFFRTKRLKQIRHVMTPTINASYRPDFSESQYGYYGKVQVDAAGNEQQYSFFENGIYGSPASGRSGLLGFNLNNSLEAKMRQQTDSGNVDKKITLLESFNVGASYNMAVNEFNWSLININGRTRLFNVLDINAGALLDPYRMDSTGTRINALELDNNRPGRVVSSNLSLSTSLRSKEGNKNQPKTSSLATADELDYINSHPDAYVDFNVPWNLNVYYNVNYTKPGLTEQITQSLTFNGDLSLTSKWKISLSSGYDFTRKEMTLTSVNVYRDLHCWEMRFNWVPFGFRQSFSIDINVKSSVLRDLKLSRRRGWQDYQ